MKLADTANPVRSSWFADQGFRLSSGPYVSDGYAARKLLERFPHTDTLAEVTGGRIFRPGIFRRSWTTDPEYGVPFLSSADIFQSDLSSLAMITKKSFAEIPRLALVPGWTLITCSGMTAGRVTYARLDMDGYACSQDVIRAAPDPDRISAGYLYTFLSSLYGTPMIKGTVYGTSVKHIEPPHLANLPVPRIGEELEKEIDSLFQQAMILRAEFQTGITAATRDLFESAGLPDLIDYRWHDQPRDTDFFVSQSGSTTLRALNFSPRAHHLIRRLQEVPHRTLGDLCASGWLGRANRFKRIDGDPSNGTKLIGQRQGFWQRPEGRWIQLTRDGLKAVSVPDETTLVASRGTLGDSEVYCRAILITDSWLNYAFSEDFLRIVSGDSDFAGAYLFAFLRSEVAFRIFRSLSTGGKQQDIHDPLRRHIPIPECGPDQRARIANTVRHAHQRRHEADELEDRAQELLDAGVQAMVR